MLVVDAVVPGTADDVVVSVVATSPDVEPAELAAELVVELCEVSGADTVVALEHPTTTRAATARTRLRLPHAARLDPELITSSVAHSPR